MKKSIKAYSKQKALVKKALKDAGFTNIKINNGFYYFSGFATKNKKIIYFNHPDVRQSCSDKLLIRTATDYQDFTGGTNYFTEMNINAIQRLANSLIK